MNKHIQYIILITLIISAASCKVKKIDPITGDQKIELSKEEQEKLKYIERIQTSYFDYSFLSAKAKVKVHRTGTDFNLTFNIRAQKNEKIWISANAIGGIEVARVLLTKDSVKILDKFQKKYIAQDYNYLSEILKTNVNFEMMQDLMFGNAPRNYDYSASEVLQNGSSVHFIGVDRSTSWAVELRKDDLRLQRISMSETESKRTVEVNYGGYKLVESSNFPYQISSTASSQKESLSLILEYVKVEKVNNLEFPFNIPKNFD